MQRLNMTFNWETLHFNTRPRSGEGEGGALQFLLFLQSISDPRWTWCSKSNYQKKKWEGSPYRYVFFLPIFSLLFFFIHTLLLVEVDALHERKFMNMHRHTPQSARTTKQEDINIPAHADGLLRDSETSPKPTPSSMPHQKYINEA